MKPYITRNKTDRADAKGIPEAYRNDQIHRVPIKTLAQRTLGAVHRLRSRWIKARTAQVNTARGLLREFGFNISGTALPAFVGGVDRFPTGRHFACCLGLTPSERSSGTRRRLGSISKLGDIYLRTLLIHGARSVITHARRAKSNDRLRTWAVHLVGRTRYNKAVAALANKLPRIVWAVWRNGGTCESLQPAA